MAVQSDFIPLAETKDLSASSFRVKPKTSRRLLMDFPILISSLICIKISQKVVKSY